MSRRIMLFFSLIVFSLSTAIAEEYMEGVQYKLLSSPQPTETGEKVEVREIFWYGCPHCFRFEDYVERWLRRKPANAEFVRMPGILRPSWENHARAYYVAELLNVFDKVHRPLFNALHLEKRQINSEDALAEFFAKHGVDEDKFKKTFRSFAVETRIRRSKDLGARFQISGVPAVIVNGKYFVSNQTTGSSAETLKVINYLVNLESKK
ncbi:MAG: thiol:disulfide interchange protein DsbA/DsbL [Gammaproteobacteria bacterium]|nr:thiol:disulfide interchange protein DsbA/DsbL [Gammaproteobacteria bacterium]MDH5728591.1 thiol:disulfide interchange protein DsbA/DsbL [Gammaproteobacteria bacterium]